jgi:hypothetical protein
MILKPSGISFLLSFDNTNVFPLFLFPRTETTVFFKNFLAYFFLLIGFISNFHPFFFKFSKESTLLRSCQGDLLVRLIIINRV